MDGSDIKNFIIIAKYNKNKLVILLKLNFDYRLLESGNPIKEQTKRNNCKAIKQINLRNL